MGRWWWVAAAIALLGCGPAVTVGGSATESASATDTDTSPSGVGTGTDDSTATGPGTEDTGPAVCTTVPLPAPPSSIGGTSVGETDEALPSCSGVNGPDSMVQFIAPNDAVYVFSTDGSAVDTVLYALDTDCFGPELACNDDATTLTSSISLQLSAGQAITLVVDAAAPGGAWELSVVEAGTGTCPDEQLGATSTPWTRTGSTVGGTMLFGSDCGGLDAPERTFIWDVPRSGTYALDTFGSSLDTILHIADGECGPATLACNGDVEFSVASGVVQALVAGQTVMVVVDGLSGVGGGYELAVDRIVEDCPQTVLDKGVVPPFDVPSSTVEADNTGGASCGGWFARDRSWHWSAPAAGSYAFSVEADFAVVLSVRSGDCGEELACLAGPGATSAAIDVPLAAGQEVVIGVDGQGHAFGDMTLSVAPTTCPEANLGTVASIERFGTTVGASDTLEPSCAPGGADWVWAWTAPASGLYEISTVGSDFDTVLAIRSAACEGEELACDDDEGGDGQSLIELNAVGGQTYVIVLDGFGGATGSYQLSIAPG